MGQIITTQNLVAIKVVRHAGQKLLSWSQAYWCFPSKSFISEDYCEVYNMRSKYHLTLGYDFRRLHAMFFSNTGTVPPTFSGDLIACAMHGKWCLLGDFVIENKRYFHNDIGYLIPTCFPFGNIFQYFLSEEDKALRVLKYRRPFMPTPTPTPTPPHPHPKNPHPTPTHPTAWNASELSIIKSKNIYPSLT